MVRNQDGHCPGRRVGNETGLKGAPGVLVTVCAPCETPSSHASLLAFSKKEKKRVRQRKANQFKS